MTQKAALFPGARGWNHPGWTGDFYPEDIPGEWRLAYYANEFRTLLATEQECLTHSCDGWADEVSSAFSLFVECRDAGAPLRSWLAGSDGEGLAGLVLRPATAEQVPVLLDKFTSLAFPLFIDANVDQLTPWADHGKVNCLWRPGRVMLPAGGTAAGMIRSGDFADDRDLRRLSEEFIAACPPGCGQACLFIDGAPPDIHALRRASVMAELL